MMEVTNGSRKLLIHFADDLAGQWQAANQAQNLAAFQMGLNLFVYATGKAELHTKTDSPYIFPPDEAPSKYVPVARLQYSGNWDPEPGAWPRFARYFWWETGWTLQPATVHAAQLKFSDFPFAHLTGTTSDPPSDADAAALRQFVADGGTLFIDCCGGSPSFDATIKNSWLPAICPNGSTRFLPEDDPIYTARNSQPHSGERRPAENPPASLRCPGQQTCQHSFDGNPQRQGPGDLHRDRPDHGIARHEHMGHHRLFTRVRTQSAG